MKKYFTILIISLICIYSTAQQNKTIFIGINPSVTIEPSYPPGCFDVNIFPLVLEYNITKNFDIRGISVLNYGFRHFSSALINVGAELSFPYYLNFGKSAPATSSGFFVALGSAFTRNIYYNHKNISVFLEPGYSFLWDNKFSLIIDLQYGRTFFFYDDGNNIMGNHFGVKFILGWWVK
ncbi:MAG TPA: hypothetical protein PKN32_11855 [Bacteroidales bacterium]|nr:hypothetical protein [Bacteroidales bacterium]